MVLLGPIRLSKEAHVEPFKADVVGPREQTCWTPETIAVTVRAPSGPPLRFDMIRLVRDGK